ATTEMVLVGNDLDQEIYGNAGANFLFGGGGNDYLVGLGGDDRYGVSGQGDHIIEGVGGGRDAVYALDSYVLGAGVEIEILSAASQDGTTPLGGGNVDQIADFVSGTDKIALDDAVFTGLGFGALPAGAFVTGTVAADADDRILYDNATGNLFFDADGNGAGAAVQFATLQ